MKVEDGEERVDHSMHQSAVGSLMYLSNGIRADVTFAVSNVVEFCSYPMKHHWTAVQRIMRYLKGTSDLCPLYSGGDGQVCFWLFRFGLGW